MHHRTLPILFKNSLLAQFMVLALISLSTGAQAKMLLTPYAEKQGCATEASRKAKGRASNGCWYPKYDNYVRELITDSSEFAVGPAPADIAEVCPNYDRLPPHQRADFWVYFVQALASVESGFNKYTGLPEDMVDRHGEQIISEGLLQMSYSDRGRGPGCTFDRARDEERSNNDKTIFDPKRNLQCGVSILKWQLADNELFYKGSYWNPLRKKAKFAAAVKKCLKQSDGSAASALGCEGLWHRRILAQFWDGYPSEKRKGGKNLCGLSNHLSFCGQLDCEEPR